MKKTTEQALDRQLTWPETLTRGQLHWEDTERAGHWETCALGELANIEDNVEIGEYGQVTNSEIGEYFGEKILELGKDFAYAVECYDLQESRRIYTLLEIEFKKHTEKTKEVVN